MRGTVGQVPARASPPHAAIHSARAEVQSPAMPDAASREITACLWDLRAQCEQQLRALTDAQRLADEFAGQPSHRGLLKGRLVSDIEMVHRAARAVQSGAEDCADLVRRLPAVAEDEAPPLAADR